QPQYSMLWRVIESQVVPTSEREGISQIVWSPIAQGVLTGKYLPGQPVPEGSRATDATGSKFIQRFMSDDVLEKVQQLKP
ncbi:aldo/keto reductase, partial [Saccharothrix sp. MB29]|nr:aldo/keto reductase [Saccharothrix sp. MB29]